MCQARWQSRLAHLKKGELIEDTVAFNTLVHTHSRLAIQKVHTLVTSKISKRSNIKWVKLKSLFSDEAVPAEIFRC